MHDGLICNIIGLKIVMAEAEFGKKEETGIKAEVFANMLQLSVPLLEVLREDDLGKNCPNKSLLLTCLFRNWHFVKQVLPMFFAPLKRLLF